MSGMRFRFLPLALVALSFSSFGQTQAFDTQLTRDGVTLNYQDARGALAAPQRKRVIDTFFFAYLRERADFHPAAPAMVPPVARTTTCGRPDACPPAAPGAGAWAGVLT